MASDIFAAYSADLADLAQHVAASLRDPAVLVQFGLIAVAIVVGRMAGRALERRLEPRVRLIRGRPQLLRISAVLLRRAGLAGVAAALWIASAAGAALGLPGGAGLVIAAAALATAWAAISVAVRIIRNRTLGRIVGFAAWLLVAAELVGIREEAASVLDRHAVAFGAVRVSLLSLAQGVVLLVVLVALANMIGRAVDRRLAHDPDITPSFQVLIGKLARIGLVGAAVFVALSAMGLDLSSLTLLSGAVGIGIGIGLQKVVSNFVSGIVILLDKSIKPGDVVEIGEDVGIVRSLRARYVSVSTRSGFEILVPNEDFVTSKVVNWSFTDPTARLDVTFGVSYDDDPHAVRRIAVETARAVDRVLPDPAPVCHITGFGESSIDFVLRFWVADPQNGLTNVRGNVLLALWDAFQQAGVTIPYPVREIRRHRDRQMPRGGDI